MITIAHNSDGPKSDIKPYDKTEYLVTTPYQYTHAIHQVFKDGPNTPIHHSIRQKAQVSVQRFSNATFITSFQKAIVDSNLLI